MTLWQLLTGIRVAKENISIWNGTDGGSLYGSDSDSINRGAKLYALRQLEAMKADKAPAKGGKK